MNNQYKYSGRPLTPRIAQEFIQELFAGQTAQRQEIIRAVDEAHLERGGLPKRSIAHPVGSALSALKRSGQAENPSREDGQLNLIPGKVLNNIYFAVYQGQITKLMHPLTVE